MFYYYFPFRTYDVDAEADRLRAMGLFERKDA